MTINIYCHYTSSCITETNISLYMIYTLMYNEIFLLYIFSYNKNIYCHYILSCIIRNTREDV